MSCFQIDNVSLTYGEHRVLQNIHLTINKGDTIGLLGRNGSGKSSLLQTLFGSIPQASKHVRIDDIYYMDPFKSQRVLLVPQGGYGFSYFSPRTLMKWFQCDKEQLLSDDIISRVWDQTFAEMSGGESKYIEIVTALHSSRDLIFLDEPFSFLSPILVEKLKELLMNSTKTKGILLTDHQYRQVNEVSNRHYLLLDGHLIEYRNFSDLQELGYIS